MKTGNSKKKKTALTARWQRMSFSEEEMKALAKALVESGRYDKEPDQDEGNWWNQIYAISLDLPLTKNNHCIKRTLTITLKSVNDAFFKLDRFKCFMYTDTLKKMFDTNSHCMIGRGKTNWVTFKIICGKVWKPGAYTLLVHDDDDDSLLRIRFSLGEDADIKIELFRSSLPLGSGVYNMLCAYEAAQDFPKEEVIAESTDLEFKLIVASK